MLCIIIKSTRTCVFLSWVGDCVYCVDSVKGKKRIIIIQTCEVCNTIIHTSFRQFLDDELKREVNWKKNQYT